MAGEEETTESGKGQSKRKKWRMAREEGTTKNGKDYRKWEKMNVNMLVEAEDRKKKWRDTRIIGKKNHERTNQYKVGGKKND